MLLLFYFCYGVVIINLTNTSLLYNAAKMMHGENEKTPILACISKVTKGTKIRNRYNQVQHLTLFHLLFFHVVLVIGFD